MKLITTKLYFRIINLILFTLLLADIIITIGIVTGNKDLYNFQLNQKPKVTEFSQNSINSDILQKSIRLCSEQICLSPLR